MSEKDTWHDLNYDADLLEEVDNLKEVVDYARLIPFWPIILDETRDTEVWPFLVAGIIMRESTFYVNAQGASAERGLGQPVEQTWKEIMPDLPFTMAYNPFCAIRFIVRYLTKYGTWLKNIYNVVDPRWVLACYNWGSGNVQNVIKQHGATIKAWDAQVPAIRRNYVCDVLSYTIQFYLRTGPWWPRWGQ